MYNDKIRGITRDKYANIWFVNLALGIFKLDKTSDTVVRYSIPQSTPLPFSENIPMFCDGYDNIWYSSTGKFVKFSGGKIKIIDSTEIPEQKNDTVSSIQIMSDNSIIVLMKHSIGQYKDINGNITFTRIDIPTNLLNNNEYFFMIKVDLEGNCWILSRLTNGSGIASQYFYKLSKNKEWTKYEFPIFDGTSQNLYSFSDFTIDEKGKVWFSEPYYGVFVFDSKATSVEEKFKNSNINISPNPATDFLEISLPDHALKNVAIHVYNVFGECIKEIPHNPPFSKGEIKLDVSSLPPGVYFVKVGEKVGKFVKY